MGVLHLPISMSAGTRGMYTFSLFLLTWFSSLDTFADVRVGFPDTYDMLIVEDEINPGPSFAQRMRLYFVVKTFLSKKLKGS